MVIPEPAVVRDGVVKQVQFRGTSQEVTAHQPLVYQVMPQHRESEHIEAISSQRRLKNEDLIEV